MLKNLMYYELSLFNDFANENDNVVYFIFSNVVIFVFVYCRKYEKFFQFNNKLHKHVKNTCFNKQNFSLKIHVVEFSLNSTLLIKILRKIFTTIKITKIIFMKKIFANSIFAGNLFANEIKFVSIISSNVDYNKNVNIDHEFRE